MLKILLTALTALVIVWLLGPLVIPILTRLKPDKTEREIAPEPPPQSTKKKKEPPPKPPARSVATKIRRCHRWHYRAQLVLSACCAGLAWPQPSAAATGMKYDFFPSL